MKEYYSQNGEDKKVEEFFAGYVGCLLDIGANDGMTLSNSYRLIQDGWEATLVEPSIPAFDELKRLHAFNERAFPYNVAIDTFSGIADFYESGEHLGKGDTSLLSTLNKEETKRWGDHQKFEYTTTEVIDFNRLLLISPFTRFDFITIDAEGNDLKILYQMNLRELRCKCLVIEWNSNKYTLSLIRAYCSNFGLARELFINAENVCLTV